MGKNNVVNEVAETNEVANLEKLIAEKKDLERRIKQLMAKEVKYERASISFPRNSTKREKRWKVKFNTVCDGVTEKQERDVTLFTTNDENKLLGGVNQIINMMMGLKEELERDMLKNVEEKKPAPKPKPNAKAEQTSGKVVAMKGGSKK